VEYAIGPAVVAAFLVDPAGVQALLDIPDAELGRLFKNRLWEVIGVATVHNLDLRSMGEEERLRKRSSRLSKVRTPKREELTQRGLANSERYSLVKEGKLLREEDFCLAAHISEKKLNKYVASGQIFSADVGTEPYYPAFFLSRMIDRDDFAKVIRRLGDTPGWSKWDFFTTPTEALGGSTPLQLLKIEEVKTVLKAAVDFAKRYASRLSK
jgi:hypothetical protein